MHSLRGTKTTPGDQTRGQVTGQTTCITIVLVRLFILVSLLVVGFGVAYSQEPQETKELSVKPENGFVLNADTGRENRGSGTHSRLRRKENQ